MKKIHTISYELPNGKILIGHDNDRYFIQYKDGISIFNSDEMMELFGMIPNIMEVEQLNIVEKPIVQQTNFPRALDVINKTVEYANEYHVDAQSSLERNNHMNEIQDGEKVAQRFVDATLVDFINFIGMKHGIDYGMYSKDLKK